MSINAVIKITKQKKQLVEAAYAGNIGIMELIKFKTIASQEQKNKLESLIKKKDPKAVWELVQTVTGVKLHKSVQESKNIKPDILPKSGAGQDGTDTLVKTYKKDTPGQNVKKFKEYIYKYR
jgi:hypothetical protein